MKSGQGILAGEAYGWYVVFVICVCGVVAFIDRQVINLLVEDIKVDLLVSDTQISLLQGFAFAFFYALVAIPHSRQRQPAVDDHDWNLRLDHRGHLLRSGRDL